jgi:type I restriction enzyme S subunit
MIQTFQKNSQGLTSDTWNLKYPMISKIKINVPSLEEQTKIANFLSAIDRYIELVTKKIEHTKTYKKGLLQQMFV